MYAVDEEDRAIEVLDFPQPSVGAPMPFALAKEGRTVLAYLIQQKQTWWDTLPEQIAKMDLREVALVRFHSCIAQMWGPPNDEAFEGHPLARRGLRVYGIFRIESSSWVRQLERMNSIHPRHNPEVFWKKKHYIFAFHDSTFECVCEGFDVRVTLGAILEQVSEMLQLIEAR